MTDLVRRPESAVAVAEHENVSPELIVANMIRDVARMDGRDGTELQRWVVKITLQPKHQYLVKGKSSKVGGGGFDEDEGGSGGTWQSEWSASPRAEGYDLLNRVMGVQFHVPRKVNDRHGREVPNPIHDNDYLYYRLIGIGYNDLGQLIAVSADVETDFFAAWQQERLKIAQRIMKGRDAKDILVRDPDTGMPKVGPKGELLYRLPDRDEFRAADRLHTLRVFGGRMAETIARRRILTQFCGIRTLWTETQSEKPLLRPVGVTVVGYRDKLTPDERLKQAQDQAAEVFNAPLKQVGEGEGDDVTPPVTEDELGDALEELATEAVDSAAATVQPDEPRVFTGVTLYPDVVEGETREAPPEPETVTGDTAAPRSLPGERIVAKGRATVCAALAPGSAPEERCMLLLGDNDRHGGPHKSPNYIWPQDV